MLFLYNLCTIILLYHKYISLLKKDGQAYVCDITKIKFKFCKRIATVREQWMDKKIWIHSSKF